MDEKVAYNLFLLKMVEAAKPTLGYWKIRGRGQQVRYMFALAKVEFNEVHYEVVAAADGGWDRAPWTEQKVHSWP